MNGQFGFFDLAVRHEQLSNHGDPLERLNVAVDWKVFLPLIKRAFNKTRKSLAGRRPFNRFKLRQKDIDARWSVKGGKAYYGYKDHVNIDTKHKLIRSYEVTAASEGDKWQLEKLLDGVRGNDNRVWADGAYYSAEQEANLEKKGYISRILNRTKKFPEYSMIARENRRRSKIRKRVEHVFGFIQNSMCGKFIRTIGMTRAKVKVGLMNLVYNLCRYEQLCRIGTS